VLLYVQQLQCGWLEGSAGDVTIVVMSRGAGMVLNGATAMEEMWIWYNKWHFGRGCLCNSMCKQQVERFGMC
jgi:hypothetical protein